MRQTPGDEAMRNNIRTQVLLAAMPAFVLFFNGCASPTENAKPGLALSLDESVNFGLEEAIVFSSTRSDPTANPLLAAEIYIMSPLCMTSPSCPRRLTENSSGDGFPALSPDGKKIAFDSNRLRLEGEALNTSDLFIMDTEGEEQTYLLRGSSATWSPESKNIAFHASASGTGLPIRPDPGSATLDSDIFVVNVDDLLAGVEGRKNITNDPLAVDDDPDWSPDGTKLLFTSHLVTDNQANSITAEIYTINADGTGDRVALTANTEEERAPAWSPDGTRIVFSCRRGGSDFEICVMNADGTDQVQLTNNSVADLTATWSLDGQKIMFHRPVAGRLQLFLMNAFLNADLTLPTATQITNTVGTNGFPNWGEARVKLPN
jgi:TolB protein